MESEFWRRKWRDDRQGWRQPAPNPLLIRHFDALELSEGARVFVPLCGDSVDIGWLLGRGFRVAGAELVESAVERLFASLGLTPSVTEAGRLKRFTSEGLDLFVGDLFDLDADALGPIDATYDRAALVALPPETRPRYAAHVSAITARAPQLLITFDYDQSQMEGPPFSVPEREVRYLYEKIFEVGRLEDAEVDGGLKGFCPATETVWRLSPR